MQGYRTQVRRLTVLVKYYTMFVARWEKMGKPARGWILEKSLCEDFKPNHWRSEMYTYWRSLYGLSNNYKIGLSQWRLEKLAEIEIYPNRAEIVKTEKDEIARQIQSEDDEHTQRIIARKEAAKNEMADEEDESEEEVDDFFVGL